MNEIDQLRELLRAVPPERVATYSLITLILTEAPLAEPGHRAEMLTKAAGTLAYVLPAGTPWRVVAEVLRPSVAAMDCVPEGTDYWLEWARNSYDRVAVRRAEAVS